MLLEKHTTRAFDFTCSSHQAQSQSLELLVSGLAGMTVRPAVQHMRRELAQTRTVVRRVRRRRVHFASLGIPGSQVVMLCLFVQENQSHLVPAWALPL
jgi:hypothetical protein